MGQRTMLYTIAENKDGKMKVNGYYHQWGIGRIMPEAAMEAIIGCFRRNRYTKDYDFCKTLKVADGRGFLLEYDKVFEPTDELGRFVWHNPRMIGEMACQHDNNNGAVVVYAKESEDEKWAEFRIGFLLGYEDEWRADSPDDRQDSKDLGPAFSRWLTFEEFAGLSIHDYIKDNFKMLFKCFCEEYGVEIKSWDN